MKSHIFLVLLYITYSFAQSNNCQYTYDEWTECENDIQNRTAHCVCDGVETSMEKCRGIEVEPLIQECVEYVNCKWKWSRWTACSEVCGGGNTTRVPQCYCQDIMTPVPDDKCDVNLFYGRESVPCNEYACDGGSVPALNKLYWISKDETTNWPIENRTFNCSQGYDDDEDSPMGKTYSQVLSDPYPATHKHYEWYFLAKEWITAELNMANGVVFSPEAMEVINAVSGLLENCKGFSEEQIPLVYASKEKLGRLNNNIGGLSNVDEEIVLMTTGRNNEENPETSVSRMTFILAIAVPLAAVVITAVALALTIYYVRDKTTVAKEEFESEDEEEPLQNTTGNEVRTDNQVPLEMEQVPTTRDESTSEEQL